MHLVEQEGTTPRLVMDPEDKSHDKRLPDFYELEKVIEEGAYASLEELDKHLGDEYARFSGLNLRPAYILLSYRGGRYLVALVVDHAIWAQFQAARVLEDGKFAQFCGPDRLAVVIQAAGHA